MVFDCEELGLVVTSDGGISVSISWKEGQLFGHIVGLHGVLLYDLVFRMRLVFVLSFKKHSINLL